MNEYRPSKLFPEENVPGLPIKSNKLFVPKNLFPEESEVESTPEEGFFKKNIINPIKSAKGSNALETAGNLAELMITKPIEMTGLPSIARGSFQSAENLLRGVGNFPSYISELAGHPINRINIPGTNQQIYPIPATEFPKIKNVNPYIGETGEAIGSLVGLSPIVKLFQQSQKAINAIPLLKKAPSMTKNILSAEIAGLISSPDNRPMGAALGGLFGTTGELAPRISQVVKNSINKFRIKPKVTALENAEYNLLAAKDAEEMEKKIASHQFKQNDPDRLLMSAADKQAELEESQKFVNAHENEELSQMKPGEQSIQEAEGRHASINDQISTLLEPGKAHSEPFAKHIVENFRGIKNPETGKYEGGIKGISRNLYNESESSLGDSIITVPKVLSESELLSINKQIDKKFGQSLKPEIREQLINDYSKGQTEQLPAKEYFKRMRTLKHESEEAYSRAFKGDLSPTAFDEWIDRAKLKKTQYLEAEKNLESHLKGDALAKLKNANKFYATEVAPVHENPLYNHIKTHGKYEGNLINSLSGTTPGNENIINMIKQNPELSRLMIGHEYSFHPEKLLQPNERLERFANMNSEIKKLMQQQKESHSLVNKAKNEQPIIDQIIKNKKTNAEIESLSKQATKLKDASEETNISKEEVKFRKDELEKVLNRIQKLKDKSTKSMKFIAKNAGKAALTSGSVYLGIKAAGK